MSLSYPLRNVFLLRESYPDYVSHVAVAMCVLRSDSILILYIEILQCHDSRECVASQVISVCLCFRDPNYMMRVFVRLVLL